MIIAKVIRSEGLASAWTRTRERIAETASHGALLARSRFAHAEILNVSFASLGARRGGISVQLMARLREERKLRAVALSRHLRDAKLIQIEGTSELPIDDVRRMRDKGVEIIVSVLDFTIYDRRDFFDAVTEIVFPSGYLRNAFALGRGVVIEPGVHAERHVSGERHAIAYAGAINRKKGAQLLPAIARGVETLHVFGGAGDHDLVRELRRVPNIVMHGYYRAGTLPELLERHRVKWVVLPCLYPETYGLVMTEAWLGGAAVAAFDNGALAERIRRDGGGVLAPLESGADGLIELLRTKDDVKIPAKVAMPVDAARAHGELYRRLGFATAVPPDPRT